MKRSLSQHAFHNTTTSRPTATVQTACWQISRVHAFTLSQYFWLRLTAFTGRLAVNVRSEEAVCQPDRCVSARIPPKVLKRNWHGWHVCMTCVASGGDTAPGHPAAAPSANLNTGFFVIVQEWQGGCCNVCVRACVCVSIPCKSVKMFTIFNEYLWPWGYSVRLRALIRSDLIWSDLCV